MTLVDLGESLRNTIKSHGRVPAPTMTDVVVKLWQRSSVPMSIDPILFGVPVIVVGTLVQVLSITQ